MSEENCFDVYEQQSYMGRVALAIEKQQPVRLIHLQQNTKIPVATLYRTLDALSACALIEDTDEYKHNYKLTQKGHTFVEDIKRFQKHLDNKPNWRSK